MIPFLHKIVRNLFKKAQASMTVIQGISLSKDDFTWDSHDPNYSTLGQFDPTKKKVGTGSCQLNVVKSTADFRYDGFSNIGTNTNHLLIVGPGVP